MGWASRLAYSGGECLERAATGGSLARQLSAADPYGSIVPRSRVLCAGLSELARITYGSLGGSRAEHQVRAAAAKLALLTKLDDEVIDAQSFHGGSRTVRVALRQRTRAYLEPTLQSIVQARPAEPSPRCAFAASLGSDLRALAGESSARLERLLRRIEQGWATQVDSVVCFTACPSASRAGLAAQEEAVLDVSQRISGDWLSMIALVGTLPLDASDGFSDEVDAQFYVWGRDIQRADALADFDKDQAEGLVGTWAGLRAADMQLPSSSERLATWEVLAERRARLERSGARQELVAPSDLLQERRAALAEFPELASLFAWIYEYLLARYDDHETYGVIPEAASPSLRAQASAARREGRLGD